jgi:hypothetical protein
MSYFRMLFDDINSLETLFLSFVVDRAVESVEDFDKIRKNDLILRRDNTIFKVIIAPTLNEFCFQVKAIHLQDTTKSPITESKFR